MNAKVPLHVTTPDGYGQVVHPDVVCIPEGFCGYRFWMAVTPYPFGRDRFENPVIRVSNDGLSWSEVDGAPDPLVPAPEARHLHHADPDLVFDGTRLLLFYVVRNKLDHWTDFMLIESPDGRRWSVPRLIYRERSCVCPAIVRSGGRWHMWYVPFQPDSCPQRSQLRLRVSGTPCQFYMAEETVCSLDIPGHVIWHIDMIAVDQGYEALVSAFPKGKHPTRCRVFHVASLDGIHFELTSHKPLIKPSVLGWDNRMIYRSTFLKETDGSYKIWYSAASWGMHLYVGYLAGKLSDARAIRPREVCPRPPLHTRLLADAVGFVKYLIIVYAPQAVSRVLLDANRKYRKRADERERDEGKRHTRSEGER
jgi:hypothetical protein